MSLTAADLKVITGLIRTLRDRKQEGFFTQVVTINPQLLIGSNVAVYGPFKFRTSFSKTPTIVFGQAANGQQAASGFFCQPRVDSWVSTSGGITAVNIAILALTAVPANLTAYDISFMCSGKASYYKSEGLVGNWQASYTHGTSSHLSTDLGKTQTPS